MKFKCSHILLIFVSLFISACSENNNPVSNEPGYTYQVPQQTNDGWTTSSLGEVEMSAEPIIDLINELLNRDDDFIHSILIAKNGLLVFEEYFPGHQFDLINEFTLELYDIDFDKNTLQFQGSTSKSFTSALVGIAIDQGLIQSVDQALFSFFPDYSELNIGEKNNITLRHLLTMTSGYPWYDSDIDANESDEVIMLQHEDPIRFLLERPLSYLPGTHMDYNSGSTVLLGEIIHRVSGMDLHDFAEQYLFEPLGITNTEWAHCLIDQSITFASGGLYIRPRDMAKFGQLFLQEGIWNGQQIISSEWVIESTRESVSFDNHFGEHYGHTGYGYWWWLGRYDGNLDAYMAMGFGGQFIIVIPEIDIVIVITGGNYDANSPEDPDPFIVFDYIVYDHILTALQ